MSVPLIAIEKVIPGIQMELSGAKQTNPFGHPIYQRNGCYLHPKAAEALKKAHAKFQQMGFTLVVIDGYRPSGIQKMLIEKMGGTSDYLEDETVCPRAKGIAVDITLRDKEGNLVEFQSSVGDYSLRSSIDRIKDVAEQVRKNREMLQQVMKEAGFKACASMWWSFSLNSSEEFPTQNLRPYGIPHHNMDSHLALMLAKNSTGV